MKKAALKDIKTASFLGDLDIDDKTRVVRSRESARREFKVAFERADLPRYAKTMAAFANAQGGMLIFGIRNKPRELIGCSLATIPDEAEFATQLQNWFDPAPRFEIKETDVFGYKLLAITVEESDQKPVICKRNQTGKKPKKNHTTPDENEAVLTEGDIYYRYVGKTDRIRFADLQGILRDRERRIYDGIMSSLAAVRKIGVERVGIVDRKAINADKRTTKLFVPRDALSTLNLIDRGRFVESPDEGERAFFVIGDVEVGYANLIDDHDRLLPSKAADALADEARVYLYPTVKLNQSHLAEFAKARGLRSPTEKERYNDNYCKFDELSKRWFYRSAFIELVKQAMRDSPLEAARDLKLGAKQRSALEAKARSAQPLAEADPRRKSEAATG